jgi:predicted transcriptional regulator
MNNRGYFITAVFLLLGFSFIISASADSGGYTVEPATPDMITGPPVELVPVQLWELPPRVLAIYAALAISPLLLFPVELLFFIKLFAYFGFRKVANKNVLENPSRNEVFHFIRETPGANFAEISLGTGVSRNSLRYHLAILKLTNKVTILGTSRNKRYFENSGRYPAMEQKVLKFLHNTPTRTLLQLLRKNPDLTRIQMEAALGISGAGVNWHMNRLSDEGLLVIKKVGRHARYEINYEIIPYLEKYLPRYEENSVREKNT